MKRFLFNVLILLLLSNPGMAQRSALKDARDLLNQNKPVEAFALVEQATQNRWTNNNPETWILRAEVLIAVFHSKQAISSVKNPLAEAFSSIKKAQRFDNRNKMTGQIDKLLTALRNSFRQKGIINYKSTNYNLAQQSFEKVLEINQLQGRTSPDTANIYNAGLSAQKAGNYTKALNYFKKVAELKYGGSKIYLALGQIYITTGNTQSAIDILNKGITLFPNDNALLILELVNLYLSTNKPAKAIEFLEMAIENDPENAEFYFTLGTLYDDTKQNKKALAAYKKALEIQPGMFSALFNLGVQYFNQGAEFINKAENETITRKYEVYIQKAQAKFKASMPLLEKAHQLKPKNKEVIEMLKTVYTELQMYHKAKKMKELL